MTLESVLIPTIRSLNNTFESTITSYQAGPIYVPSILYSGGIFLHNKFFLCRYL